MSKKLFFVFNPHSGKAQIKNKLLEILDIFVKNSWTVTVHPTQNAQDAYETVRSCAADYDLLVVSGGDGTLNEAIRGVMSVKRERRPEIGYIPAGTTNDFASSLKIPKSMTRAAENIMTGHIFRCDVGNFNNGKYFTYVAAFGAFTDVSYETPQEKKNLLGQTAYFLEGIKKLHTLKSEHIRVCYGDTEFEDDFIFGMVSNTNYVGGFETAKAFKAQLNDGLFEVVLIKRPKSLLDVQELISNIVTQQITSDAFCIFKTDNVRFISDKSLQWTLDGEYGGSFDTVDIKTEKEAVTLVLGERK